MKLSLFFVLIIFIVNSNALRAASLAEAFRHALNSPLKEKYTTGGDVNEINLLDQSGLTGTKVAKIITLLQNPAYNLLNKEFVGESFDKEPASVLRVDIVMQYIPQVYRHAIFTAFANRNIELLNIMAERIVENACSSKNVVEIVNFLRNRINEERKYESVAFEKLFVDKVFRLAVKRFS